MAVRSGQEPERFREEDDMDDNLEDGGVTVGIALGLAMAAQAGWFLLGARWPVPVVACPVLTTGWWWLRGRGREA